VLSIFFIHFIVSGEITDLNVWSRVLTKEELSMFGNCIENNLEGDLMSWLETIWELKKVKSEEMALFDVCQEKEDNYMIFPELRFFDDIFSFCSSVGALMASPANLREMEEFRNATQPFFADQVRQCGIVY